MKKQLLQAILNEGLFYNTNPKFESFKKGVNNNQLKDCEIECFISGKEMILKVTLEVRGKVFSCKAGIPCGLITKSGYVSTKKMPVSFDYSKETILSDEQVKELSYFFSDAKSSNYNPFFSETKANHESMAKMMALCENITDPYDIG